jgi:hypothetical protein
MRTARLRSAASFRNRIGKQEGAPSRRQGRGALERDDQMDDVQPEKIAGRRGHFGWSDFGVATRCRWNQCRGWQEPGDQDDRADHPGGGQGDGHCKTWPKLQHPWERLAGTTVGRAGRVHGA